MYLGLVDGSFLFVKYNHVDRMPDPKTDLHRLTNIFNSVLYKPVLYGSFVSSRLVRWFFMSQLVEAHFCIMNKLDYHCMFSLRYSIVYIVSIYEERECFSFSWHIELYIVIRVVSFFDIHYKLVVCSRDQTGIGKCFRSNRFVHLDKYK